MANATTCDVETCGRAVWCRGYCHAHYDRLNKWGDVRADQPLRQLPTKDERADIVGRIFARTVRTDSGCVQWTGPLSPSGYAAISWDGRERAAHRVMWTVMVGPIPTDDDWTIDHLCSNRACVNVGHMEVVTRTENSQRGGGLLQAQRRNVSAPSCRNGHEYDDDSPIDVRGYRLCKACERETWQRQKDVQNARRRASYAAKREQGIGWREARLARGQA